jgi:YidC/Oxa1 family membrane protein insertase
MVDNKNLILAIVLSVAILLGFDLLFGNRQTPPLQQPQQSAETAPAPQGSAAGPAPSAPPAVPGAERAQAPQAADRGAVLAQSPRVQIESPRLHGSISLKGARLDDLTLVDYHVTPDPASPEIVLLTPSGTEHAYFTEVGWVPVGNVAVPDRDATWTADRSALRPGEPVTLTYEAPDGLVYKRTYALDRDFLFTITQTVENHGTEPVRLFPYELSSRRGTPKTEGFYILHEGLIGVFGGTLKEVDYDEIKKDAKIEAKTTGGWIGITDKYWLVALIPDQLKPVTARFLHTTEGTVDRYQVDTIGEQVTVAPGAIASVESRLFAGAKEVKLLDAYSDNVGIQRLDLAVDFGWFFYLTKPIFYILDYIKNHVGNFGVAILILTVLIKLIMFPLANKSYRAMSKMKLLQPEMVKIRERCGDDRQRMNQEMMALYKREKANPASGCLPIVIQIPVFFALYKVLYVTIEMRHAPFYGWIHDLSAPDPTTVFNLFGLIPWMPPDFLMIGAWPLVMGVTMYLQQKLNPAPADPIQAKVFMFLPVIFTVMLAQFSAGLVIYWAWNNALSILQQWVIMKRAGAFNQKK